MFQVERLEFERDTIWAWVDEVAIAAGPVAGWLCYPLHVCILRSEVESETHLTVQWCKLRPLSNQEA